MDLALQRRFDVRVVPLPAGLDPADAADRFQELLATAESYPVYRVKLEHRRESDRRKAFDIVWGFLARTPDSVDRQDACRVAEDIFQVAPGTFEPRALARKGGVSRKQFDAGDRLERDALAGAVSHPELVLLLAELTPEHFDLELHRRVREYLVSRGSADEELIGLLAELDARAAAEEIDETTATELLLRLRERGLRRELARSDDPKRAKELQEALTRIREAVAGLS